MNLFIENKYTRWYFAIVSTRPQRSKVSDYFESHHIIPRALGGSNEKPNLVLLTAREHFVVHWLLTKMCIDPEHKRKMLYAISAFRGRGTNNKQQRIFSSFEYSVLRRKHNEAFRGENHPLFGKKHSSEHVRKISEGNSGKIRTEEHKANYRKPKTSQHTANISSALMGHEVTAETRSKISNSLKGTKHPQFGSFWITDGIVSQKLKPGSNIPSGWRRGRIICT